MVSKEVTHMYLEQTKLEMVVSLVTPIKILGIKYDWFEIQH